MRVEHDAVADDRELALAHDAGGQQRELVGLGPDDEGVAGVVAALEAHDHVGLLGEPVDDLALALVAPLGADHHDIRHCESPHEKPRRKAGASPCAPSSGMAVARSRRASLSSPAGAAKAAEGKGTQRPQGVWVPSRGFAPPGMTTKSLHRLPARSSRAPSVAPPGAPAPVPSRVAPIAALEIALESFRIFLPARRPPAAPRLPEPGERAPE